MKRVALPSQRLLAVLGEVDAGEHADRACRASVARLTIASEPKMALARPPVSACGGGVISVKSAERHPADAEPHGLDQDPDQPEQAERHRGERQGQRDRVGALAPRVQAQPGAVGSGHGACP